MRFGVLGVIWSDWTDVSYETVAFARELGFAGIGAHLTVPASTISEEIADGAFHFQRPPLCWSPDARRVLFGT